MAFRFQQTSNAFVDKLNFYQSANTDNASVKKNFVIRTHEFKRIIAALRTKKKKDPLQHELIIGWRGSGKSTLLRRIQIELEEDTALAQKYISINLAEEQATIYRLSDLWYEVLQEIAIRENQSLNLKLFSSFEDPVNYTRYLYDQIHESLQTSNKKVVLLLDNLDRILGNFSEDAQLLRETLINYNDLAIIGGSTRMSEHYWKYDQPFYEFFRIHRLESLTFNEIHTLLHHWGEVMDIPGLKNYSRTNKGKIEALRILTDGLPRTLQFFTEILLQESDLYGFQYLQKVMDRTTPLYQERLNNLTAAQRKIVVELAFIWEAAPTKQLVDKCRIPGKLISSYLKQIRDFGLVTVVPTGTKNHLYRLSERFFNMWLIVTQGNPEQKRRAKYLTIFLESWYEADQLKILASAHLEKMKKKSMSFDKAVVLSQAYSQSKYIDVHTRDALIDGTLALDDGGLKNAYLPKKFSTLREELVALEKEERYEEALRKVDEISNEGGGVKFFLKAYFMAALKDEAAAEKNYLRAIEAGHVDAMYNLALLYKKQAKLSESEAYYLRAIEAGDVNALNNLANLYEDQDKLSESETYYLRAIEAGDVNALFNLALLYSGQGKLSESETYYLRAIEAGHVGAMNNLAILYEKQGKLSESETYYLRAIEAGHVDALFNLALLYSGQGKLSESEAYYLRAIEADDVRALYNLALLYEDQDKLSESEAYYLRAIEAGHVNAMYNLAVLYYRTKQKKKEASDLIRAYRAKDAEDEEGIQLELVIDVWNGRFDQIENRMEKILLEIEDSAVLIEQLLNLEQKHLLLTFFESAEQGQVLRDKYQLLYYAILILCNRMEGHLELRIPEEVWPTVQEIVDRVREKNQFYGS